MESPRPKLAELTGEEFIRIGETARPFWERGFPGNPPKFVIFMGGIASGKTTIRRQQYEKDYVHFDYGEILSGVEKAVGRDHERVGTYAALACDLILRESLAPRRNIVIEIIGESSAPIMPVIGAMKQLGYDVSVVGITADLAEARQRYLKAIDEDSTYLSAYYTQEPTLAVFYHVLELGEMPSFANDQ